VAQATNVPSSKPEARPAAISLSRPTEVSRASAAGTIIEDLRGLIATGAIGTGSRLPTERDLAVVYKVSPSTVRESMRALAVMGLIEVRHASGSSVVEDTANIVTSSLATAMHVLESYPWQMSGGMQQRVAIARALVVDPRVILTDEPFASVDARTRESLEDLVLRIRNEDEKSVVLIIHDIDEAIYPADRVIVLGGRPAGVRASIPIPFGRHRDQLAIKAEPESAELRAHVHALISAPLDEEVKQ
jgi:ABC-type cobalamin/Fe3+-siderophores transport system ATPase subunit